MHEHHPNASFGELRSILHQVPSARRWEQFCLAIEPWEPHTTAREDILAYALSFLQHWPAQYRRPPTRWLGRQLDASSHPPHFWLWPIVRVLDLGEVTPLSPTHLTHALLAPITLLTLSGPNAHLFLHRLTQLSPLRLTHLTIERWPLSPLRLIEQLRRLDLPDLQVLRLTHSRQTSPSLDALCQLPWFNHLKLLDLSYNHIDDRALDMLLATPPTRLEHLELTGNKLSMYGARRLLKHPFTRQLYTLSLGHNLDLSPSLHAKLLGP